MQLLLPLLPRALLLVGLLQITTVTPLVPSGRSASQRRGRIQWQVYSNTLVFQDTKKQPQKRGDDQIEKFPVASSRGSDAVTPSKVQQNDNGNGWDSFKSAVYGTVDGVGSLSEKLKSNQGDSGVVEGGYATIEKKVLGGNSNLSPGQRLMNEYRARSATTEADAAPSGSGSSSAFDAFKTTVYGGMDAASQVFSDGKNANDIESLRSFKPLVQSTLSSSEIQKALPGLQSSNPITRRIAEGKIKNWEEKERKRQRAIERDQAARKFKESVYQFGDAVVWSAETLATVPSKVADAAAETEILAKSVKKSVDEIPGKVDKVVNTVTSIPDQVKAKSGEVQATVATSVENTKKAIEEVKAVPTKIDNSIKDTKQKVTAAKEAVDDAATSVKVLVGLEKPIPKPPKSPPPPPPTASELGLKMAGSVVNGVASGTAKLAWWAGKGTAIAAWKGVQSAYDNALAAGKQDKTVTSVAAKISSSTVPAESSTSDSKPASDKETVDREVQEALELAQTAIEFADMGLSATTTTTNTTTAEDKKSDDGNNSQEKTK